MHLISSWYVLRARCWAIRCPSRMLSSCFWSSGFLSRFVDALKFVELILFRIETLSGGNSLSLSFLNLIFAFQLNTLNMLPTSVHLINLEMNTQVSQVSNWETINLNSRILKKATPFDSINTSLSVVHRSANPLITFWFTDHTNSFSQNWSLLTWPAWFKFTWLYSASLIIIFIRCSNKTLRVVALECQLGCYLRCYSLECSLAVQASPGCRLKLIGP